MTKSSNPDSTTEAEVLQTAAAANCGTSTAVEVVECVNPDTGKKEKYYDLATVPADFKANGLKIVSMHIVNRPEDACESRFGKGFNPLFVYQFFPEPHEKCELDQVSAEGDMEQESGSESSDDEALEDKRYTSHNNGNAQAVEIDENEGLIVGFKNLKIDLAFTPTTLKPYIKVQFSESLPAGECSVPDLTAAVEEFMGHKIMTTLDALSRAVKEDQHFKPFGSMIQAWKITGKDNVDHHYDLFEVGHNAMDLGYPCRFSEYLAEIQPFLAWFIYAARVVNTDDTNWLHYFLYERVPEFGNRLVGYCSVYRYYMMVPRKQAEAHEAWTGEPKHRCRIGQFLIIPPYQKLGLGARMLHEIIASLQSNPKVYEISVEDPEPSFQRLFQTVASKCLKEYLNRQKNSYDIRAWVFRIPPHALKEFRQHLKFSKKDIIFCTDVIASEVARVEGKEALKQFHAHLASRIKHDADEEVSVFRRTLKRAKGYYYTFSEDFLEEGHVNHKKLVALWETNLTERIDENQLKALPANLGPEIHRLATKIQEVAKRMDRLDF